MRYCFILIVCLLSLNIHAQEQQLAYQYFRNGSFEKAAAIFKNLFEENPFNTSYLNYLIDCHHQLEQYETAQSIILTQMQKHPNQHYLNVELGYLHSLQHEPELAEPFYKKALESIVESPNVSYQVGRAFQDNHLLDYALKAYQKGMELYPAANFNFQIARIYGELGQVSEMMDTYLEMISRNESFQTSVKKSIGRFITDDPAAENNLVFKKLLIKRLQNNPKNSWNQLLSWLYIQQTEYDKALVQEKALYKRGMENLNNVMALGEIAAENKAFVTAKNCFNFVLKESSDPGNILLAKLMLLEIDMEQSDDFDAIKNKFNVLLDTYGVNVNTLGVQVVYADFLAFKSGETNKATAVLKRALQLQGNFLELAPARIKLADIYVFTGNYNSALVYYTQVQNKLKNHPLGQQARFKIAQTSYFKGDFDWAQTQLNVLKASTSQLIANDALDLNLLITDNGLNDSLKVALKKYAKADLLSYQNKNKQAIDTLEVLLNSYDGHPIEDEALFKQARLFEEVKQFEKAAENYKKIIALNATDILVDDAYYRLGNLYLNYLNDPVKSREYFEEIIFNYPSSIHLVDARKKYRTLRGDLIN